jgi:hypothetical protein
MFDLCELIGQKQKRIGFESWPRRARLFGKKRDLNRQTTGQRIVTHNCRPVRKGHPLSRRQRFPVDRTKVELVLEYFTTCATSLHSKLLSG